MAVVPSVTAPTAGSYVGSIGFINGDVGSLISANSYPAGVPYSTYSLSGTYIPGQVLLTSSTGVIVSDTNICYNYDYFAPLTGTTVLITQSYTLVNPAGTIAALTVDLPAAPVPGQTVHIAFSQVVTALTLAVSAPGTATFIGTPITAAAVGTHVSYMYDINANAWFLI